MRAQSTFYSQATRNTQSSHDRECCFAAGRNAAKEKFAVGIGLVAAGATLVFRMFKEYEAAWLGLERS
jgi:hypothetical protein